MSYQFCRKLVHLDHWLTAFSQNKEATQTGPVEGVKSVYNRTKDMPFISYRVCLIDLYTIDVC
jgi:hypothetical protein